MTSLTIGYLFLCISFAFAAEPVAPPVFDEAKLLASRFMLSNYAVENKDFVIDYNIYNAGDRTALKVTLDDTVFSSEHFEVVRGMLSVSWDRLAPGGNVSHSVVLRPLTPGQFNFTWATLSYLPSEDATQPRYTYTNAMGESYIYRLKDFERRFSPRMVDWSLFALMTIPSLAMPALLWYRTQAKYGGLSPSAHAKKL